MEEDARDTDARVAVEGKLKGVGRLDTDEGRSGGTCDGGGRKGGRWFKFSSSEGVGILWADSCNTESCGCAWG